MIILFSDDETTSALSISSITRGDKAFGFSLRNIVRGTVYENLHITLCTTPENVVTHTLKTAIESECRAYPISMVDNGSLVQGNDFVIPNSEQEDNVNDGDIDGGGWLLVRHVSPSYLNQSLEADKESWHPISDMLSGFQA